MNSDISSPFVDLISNVSNISHVTVSSCTLGISKSSEISDSIETIDSQSAQVCYSSVAVNTSEILDTS